MELEMRDIHWLQLCGEGVEAALREYRELATLGPSPALEIAEEKLVRAIAEAALGEFSEND